MRFFISSSSVLAAAAFHLAASFSPAADAVLLRSHWEPGKSYAQETETQTTSTLMPAPGQPVEQTLRVRQKTAIEVTADGSSGSKVANVAFASVTGEMTMMGQTHKYDSADPLSAHPLLRQALGGASGRTFAIVFDGEDRFVDVKATEKLAADGGSISGLGAMADARQVAALFSKSLDIGLSDKPVSPGDKWMVEDSLTFPQAGAMKITINSRFDEIVEREGRRHAKVIFEGKINTAPAAPDAKASAPVVEVMPDSTVAGHVFFDLERRTVSLSVFLANITLNMSGNVIPIRQQVTTKMVSVSDKK